MESLMYSSIEVARCVLKLKNNLFQLMFSYRCLLFNCCFVLSHSMDAFTGKIFLFVDFILSLMIGQALFCNVPTIQEALTVYSTISLI